MEQHVHGIQTALSCWFDSKNAHLIAYLGGEHALVYQRDTDYQANEFLRVRAESYIG